MPRTERPPGGLAELIAWPMTGVFLAALATTQIPATGPGPLWPLPACVGLATLAALLGLRVVDERRHRASLVERLSTAVRGLAEDASRPFVPPDDPGLVPLVQALRELRARGEGSRPAATVLPTSAAMTRSGLYDPPSESSFDPMASSEYAPGDMVGRLDPSSLRWLDARPEVQEYLGHSLAQLHAISFLDVVHPDHRDLARSQLAGALDRGEALGLIYRLVTGAGESRAAEVNVGVRYGADRRPIYLRCHLTDVTDKLKAAKELRKRTRELAATVDQLRRVNAQLVELRDRYTDLYQRAPAMYFSLDEAGVIRECNVTLQRTLGYRRDQVVDRPYTDLLAPERHEAFARHFETFKRVGRIEVESRWRVADGSAIDVLVTGTADRADDGTFLRSRSVAQNVTARKALEAQLVERNDRLAVTNAALSARNHELDEFAYVVSHDLQEPLRTLIAFSDFLKRDYGPRLDPGAIEYVDLLVDAAKRMRALIHDLLELSKLGRVAGDLEPVALAEVVESVRADLAELIRSKGATVTVDGSLPTVWGDRDRLGQLLANLVGNGLKYNRSVAPRVEISASVRPDGGTALSVRDDGIGIDPRHHAKIFQVFRRLHARDEYEGTGAGLAICQRIAEAHGGSIRVESSPDVGSTFCVILPPWEGENKGIGADEPPLPRIGGHDPTGI